MLNWLAVLAGAVDCVGVEGVREDVEEAGVVGFDFILFTVSSASARIFWLIPHRLGISVWHFLWQLT